MSSGTDTQVKQYGGRRRVVCELDASSRAETLLEDALALCEERDAELRIVWVLELRVFDSPFPGSAGAVGTFGLPHVLHAALARARERGIEASSAVRIGEREVVLRHEGVSDETVVLLRLDEGRSDLAA